MYRANHYSNRYLRIMNTDVVETVTVGDNLYDAYIIAENLDVPWALAIADDGRIFFTERSGNIRVIENGVLNPQPIYTFEAPFVSVGESGLMGIVLDPEFNQNNRFYVMYSYEENDQIFNRVVRMVLQESTADIEAIIIDKIPGRRIHNGGRIKIGPDQKLYIGTGDAGTGDFAQDVNSLAGKMLRLELDGSIPSDNPFIGSPVYSYGHRNPQGFTWNSDNVLYESEHGQLAHDELNIIYPGGNYGWPLVQGDEFTRGVLINYPIIHSGDDTWAPADIAFVTQGALEGRLLVALLRGQQLMLVTLNEDGTSVINIESSLVDKYGRLREVITTNDGSIYLTTSNQDGRRPAQTGDDKIIRLVPKNTMSS